VKLAASPARASSAPRSAPELPAGIDQELLLREAGRRWGLLESWAELTVVERLGELGAELRRLWAEGTPAERRSRASAVSVHATATASPRFPSRPSPTSITSG